MKKTLVSAFTTALVVGAASTTFAAANPFTDVPLDHWAYDAVTQLAADGIINGYGDGSFKGDQNITRYEMAQMIAKALAHKGDASAVDKAMIDKLAAEFGDELANLGVRVSTLEKKVDNVKWTGEAYYEFKDEWKDGDGHARGNGLMIRLEPSMMVNEHWTVHSRIESELDADAGTDSIAGTDSEITVKHLWAEGELADNLTVRLGRLYYVTNADEGMILDNPVTGAQVEAGKVLKVVATAGRYAEEYGDDGETTPATYMGLEAFGEWGKWNLGAGFHTLRNNDLFNSDSIYDDSHYIGKGSKDIYLVSARYNFSDKWSMGGVYAQGNADTDIVDSATAKAYSVQLDYGSQDSEEKGSYNIFVAYRHLGEHAVIAPTYDGIAADCKGFHFGTNYTFLKNVVGTLEYFTGKTISDDKNANIFYGKLDFVF